MQYDNIDYDVNHNKPKFNKKKKTKAINYTF